MRIRFYIDDVLLKDRSSEIEYLIAFFLYRTGIQEQVLISPLSHFVKPETGEVAICYGETSSAENGERICNVWMNRDFWHTYAVSHTSNETFDFGGIKGPVILKKPGARDYIIREGSHVRINFDLFGGIFYLITRAEEYDPSGLDEHERFPVSRSWQYKSGVIQHPCVDLWILLLLNILKEFVDIRSDTSLHDGKTCISLSFDIDILEYYTFLKVVGAPLAGLLREKKIGSIFHYSLDSLKFLLHKKPDPYWGFPQIRKMEETLSIKTGFFIIPQRKTEWEYYDLAANRNLQERLMSTLTEDDEIGLHCTYQCMDSPEEMAAEKEKIEALFRRTIHGVRHHYLRFRIPGSWYAAHHAGLSYDATLGYSKHEGFRAGTSFPFIPFDLRKRKEIPIIEIPLTAMDVTLRYHRKLIPPAAHNVLAELLNQCRATQGLLSIVWHTSNLESFGWDKWRDCLTHFIADSLSHKDVAHLSYGEICTKARERWHAVKNKISIDQVK